MKRTPGRFSKKRIMPLKKLKRASLAFAPNRSLKRGRPPVCYGYARVCVDRQAEHSLGLDSQDAEIASYYSRIVEPLGVAFKETLVSPVTTNNPPFPKRDHGAWLLNNLRPGDHVIFARVDRAFHDVLDCVAVLRELAKSGVIVHIVEFGFDSSDERRLIRGGVELLRRAQYAREAAATFSDRILEKNVIRKLKGLYRGGSVPLGFKLVGPKGRMQLAPDPQTLEVMRHFAELYDSGMNYYQIEQHLARKRFMRRVRDKTEPSGWRLEYWSRQAIARAIQQIREIDRREAKQAASVAGGTRG